jgi:NCAIR mutase (PurE)-related protein
MDEKHIRELLENVREGSCDITEAVQQLKHWPAETMDFACLDHHRALRTGFPEVVYGEDKSAEQIGAIIKAHEAARMLIGNTEKKVEHDCRGTILVMSAGTSDIPVAEEALLTAHYLGHPVKKLYDVGVAGIHRVLSQRELLNQAAVLIVVAGMEGALPSVVAGLVDKPVIAVPTSVGYGASFGGITALLGMLNSCAPGVAAVNIDNGFGAGCMAATINRQ